MNNEVKKTFQGVIFYGVVSIKDNVLIGRGTRIGEYVVISWNVTIGKDCRILYHVTISKDAIIGDNVFIGPNTSLLNDMYPPSKVSRSPIIKDGAIIGGGVTVCPNVVIGKRSVVAAGSVVTHDIPDEEVWKGNPAKFHCTRTEYDEKKKRWEELW